jgi:hypothetical protein
MRDSVSRTLIALVVAQVLFMLVLPLVLIPPPDGLELRLYAIGFANARNLVVEAAAGTVLLFTAAVWIQHRFWLMGFFPTVPLVGSALVLAPFWINTGGASAKELASKGSLFFLGYIGLAVLLGAVYWFLAVMEPGEWGSRDK